MEIVEKLLKKYSSLFSSKDNQPHWAVKKRNTNQIIHPSIPFVGDNYQKTRTLLYASAENLMYYLKRDNKVEVLDNDEIATNRHRYCFKNPSQSEFFPYVHIAPIEDGSLLLVTSYILKRLNISITNNPFAFAESIAFGNFGKYSISNQDKNKDYASNYSFIKYSLPYIETDLSILKPDVLILPKTIFDNEKIKKIIFSVLPNVIVVPIYQINARNINLRIKPKFPQKPIDEIREFYEWQKHLSNGITGKTNENFLSVYNYLDEVLSTVN